jgi:phosphoserine phosphatase RsbU/P
MENFFLRHVKILRIFGAIFIGLVLVYNLIVMCLFIPLLVTKKTVLNPWLAEYRNHKVLIGEVRSSKGEESLVQVGDEILMINGQTVKSPRDIVALLHPVFDHSYRLTFRREGKIYNVEIKYIFYEFDSFSYILLYIALLTSITCFIIGTGLFIARSNDLIVLFSALFFLCLGLLRYDVDDYQGVWVIYLIINLMIVLKEFVLYGAYYLFLIFPQKSRLYTYWSQIEFIPLVVGILSGSYAVIRIVSYIYPNTINYFLSPATVFYFKQLVTIAQVLCLLLAIISLFDNYRQADARNKPKLKLLISGFCIYILMYIVNIILTLIFVTLDKYFFTKLSVIGLLTTESLLPVLFAYAIIRHRVLPISIIVRQSVRYLLVSKGFTVVQLIIAIVALYLILYSPQLEGFRGLNSQQIIIFTLVGTAILYVLSQNINSQVKLVIDRQFFRDIYTAQRLMTELTESVRQITDSQALVATASQTLQTAFHINKVVFLLWDSKKQHYYSLDPPIIKVSTTSRTLNISAGLPTVILNNAASQTPTVIWEKDFLVVGKVAKAGFCVECDLTDPYCWWYEQASELSEMERQRQLALLQALDPMLLLPIMNKGRLEAIAVLSNKRADIPYTGEEKRMLMSAALPIGLALENARLVAQSLEEQKLQKDLELATEVQQRLFPRMVPTVPGLDIAGCSFPARGVGGDYYDFIELDPRCLGIAVADFAGKGLSAALLMSALKTSLHSQFSTQQSLAALMGNINKMLYQSTEGNTHATFFYAEYCHLDRSLTYVNAGHNPPILVRNSTDSNYSSTTNEVNSGNAAMGVASAVALPDFTTGGLVIGLLDFAQYKQATVVLQPGDILAIFTDGVSEALNKAGEEFGETRIEAFIAAHRYLTAEKLRQKFIEILQAWYVDTPQHDDITLVILKIL